MLRFLQAIFRGLTMGLVALGFCSLIFVAGKWLHLDTAALFIPIAWVPASSAGLVIGAHLLYISKNRKIGGNIRATLVRGLVVIPIAAVGIALLFQVRRISSADIPDELGISVAMIPLFVMGVIVPLEWAWLDYMARCERREIE